MTDTTQNTQSPEYVTIGFDNLSAGTVVANQFEGVSIIAQRSEDGGLSSTSENDAMIFDTANPTGGDNDLATDTQGSVLIISEDNDSSDPDDEAHGGAIQFKFDNPAYVKDLNIVDTEHGGVIRAYDADGILIVEVLIPTGRDGDIRNFDIDAQNVSSLVVEFNSSGALDDLRYLPGADPVEELGALEGTYFMDANANAVEDSADMGVEGATIFLLNASADDVVAQTTTDADGNYRFDDLSAGDYVVRFETPEALAGQQSKTFVIANAGNDDSIDSDVTKVDTAGNGTTGTVQVVAGETTSNVDGGIELVDHCTASISGTYFMDNNDNSVEDAGDMAVEGATVYLLLGGRYIATTTTDAQGNYSFDGLHAGSYSVSFAGQDGKGFVDANAGNDDTIDSDVIAIEVDSATSDEIGITQSFDLAIGEHRANIDAGVELNPVPAASVGGTVFMDNNDNAVEDAGDMTLAGVEVILMLSGTGEVARTTTDADGNYLFADVTPADGYSVQFASVDGKDFVAANAGNDDTIDSDAVVNADGAATATFDLAPGEDKRDLDAGVATPAPVTGALEGRVFCDDDNDGIDNQGTTVSQGAELIVNGGFEDNFLSNDRFGFSKEIDGWTAAEDKIEVQKGNYGTGNTVGNAVVELDAKRGNATLVQTVDLPAYGTYTFSIDYAMRGTNAATNGVEIYIGGDLVATLNPTESGFQTFAVALDLPAGETALEIKGAGTSDTIGTVIDNVSLRQSTETGASAGKAGVDVKLIDADGAVVATTQTDADGNYRFDDVPEGDYQVMFTALDGTEFTIQDAGSNDTDDSDTDANGMTGKVTVIGGETTSNVDAGLTPVQLASVGGTVFMDNNDNSVEDAGDMTLAGVEVILMLSGTGEVARTTTDADGNYLFTDVTPADGYSVQFGNVDGKAFVDADAGDDDTIDSDAIVNANGAATAHFDLAAGEDKRNLDAGVEVTDSGNAAIEGRVFMDVNDDSIDNDEMGVAGVTVNLVTAKGVTIATTTTSADGSYAFEGLSAGAYRVEFPTEFDGKSLVDANVGDNNAIDSDASQTTGLTGVVGLEIGQRVTDVDAGLELVDTGDATLAGRVFMDTNRDAVDNAEMGVAEVTVELLDAEGNLVATTLTDADGAYLFTGLNAGDYVVDFPTEVDGKTLVTQNAGNDDAIDSDAATDTGRTDVIALAIGENSIDNDAGLELVDTGDAALEGRVFMDVNDDSIDNDEMGVAGVTVTLQTAAGTVVAMTTTSADGAYAFEGLSAGTYRVEFPTEFDGKALVDANVGDNNAIDSDASQTTGLTGVVGLEIGQRVTDVDAGLELVDTGDAALEGRVFMDSDGDDLDNDEMGIAGVVVDLLDANGALVDTTVTDNNGDYAFTDLLAGDYIVDFPVAFEGKTIVGQNAGTDDTIDSDADTNTGRTDVITLDIGEVSTDNDAGLELVDTNDASLEGRVFLDANDNGVDNNERGVNGVAVQLLSVAGIVLAETVTAADGSYAFTDLPSGEYRVEFPSTLDGLKLVEEGVGNNTGIDSDANANTGATGTVFLEIGTHVSNVDAGFVSYDPIVGNDSGKICADKLLTINVLSNDTDLEELTITKVGGQNISNGETLTIEGVDVTLQNNKLVFNGEDAFAGLNVGETGEARISYTVSDDRGGEATANVDLTFCGVADTLVEMHASLSEITTYQVLGDDLDGDVDGEAYSIVLHDTGDVRFDGKVFDQAYCISLLDPVVYAEVAADAPFHRGEISPGDDFEFNPNQISFANGKSGEDNLDLVNWIINQDYTDNGTGRFNDWEVQRAIWELTDAYDTAVLDDVDSGYGKDSDVDFIVQQAMRDGEGFEAGKGDIATMIIDPNPISEEHSQPFIVAFDFDENNCIC